MKKGRYSVAVAGATGAVGGEIIRTLEKRRFPVSSLSLLASRRSAGKTLLYRKEKVEIKELNENSFEGVDIAFFCAGSSVSRKFAPSAVRAGAFVIDNTSAFRMNHDVPLVVPEVNREDIMNSRGIISSPDCSTIQLVIVLNPIHRKYGIRRVILSTYQSVSGAGQKAVNALLNESMLRLQGEKITARVMGRQIAFNLIPQIDSFTENGYTREEMKIHNETRKILHNDNISVNATCVRVPVLRGHSESVTVETEDSFEISDIRKLLSGVSNLIIEDDPSKGVYPMPINAEGKFDTFVGRIRRDISCRNALSMWIVSDNLLKGAAFNALQIAEALAEMDMFNRRV